MLSLSPAAAGPADDFFVDEGPLSGGRRELCFSVIRGKESAMACGRGSSFFLLLVFLSGVAVSRLPLAEASSKVSLELYYETLCPYCSRFIVNFLSKIFENGLIDIIDLKLVPYGNARIGPGGTITCQHGTNECLLNTVEACAISAWPDVKKHFRFIYCVEKLVVAHKQSEWEACFKETGLDSKPITDCSKNGEGQKLELAYAAETAALQPPHKYVPWVVVNGEPLYDDYEKFETVVCKAYKGVQPAHCKEVLEVTDIPQKVLTFLVSTAACKRSPPELAVNSATGQTTVVIPMRRLLNLSNNNKNKFFLPAEYSRFIDSLRRTTTYSGGEKKSQINIIIPVSL